MRTTLLILSCLCIVPRASLPAQVKNARGSEYMVSAPTPEAVDAALSILSSGGNAIDAAAAAAFAVLVTDPAMSSLGGRSQILLRLADGTFVGIDGATQAPLRVAEPANLGHGYGTIPVPGSPAALEKMVLEHGTLTLGEVLQPAIRLAEDGFTIKQDLHDAFRTNGETLRLYSGTRQHFLKADGSPYSEGDLFRQPALAGTLRALAAEGAGALYEGALANALVADMEANGGIVQLDDLARYRAKQGEIVEGEYRGHRIVSRGGNCDGASVVEMLQILEHFDVAEYAIDDPEYIHVVAQVLYLGNADEYVPDWLQVTKELAARRVREIDKTKALPVASRSGIDSDGETNHLSVVDAAGNAVAITQSIGPTFGSKAASPELGFFYAYSYDMNDDPVPFQREKTSQSPTIVMKAGEPFIVLGSAGSARIPGSIVRTVVNVVDFGMTLSDALAARRWSIYDNVLRIETSGLSETAVESLTAYGYTLRRYEEPDGFFARVHAVMFDRASGFFFGAADPRDLGAAGGR